MGSDDNVEHSVIRQDLCNFFIFISDARPTVSLGLQTEMKEQNSKESRQLTSVRRWASL